MRQQPAVLVLTPQQGAERNNHTAVQATRAPVGDPVGLAGAHDYSANRKRSV